MVIQLSDRPNHNVRVVIPCCYCHLKSSDLTSILQTLDDKVRKNKYLKDIDPRLFQSISDSRKKNFPIQKRSNDASVTRYQDPEAFKRRYNELKKEYSLLNLQFNRWWGWNWLRKRKDIINKVKVRCHKVCGKKCCELYESLISPVKSLNYTESEEFEAILRKNIQELYNTPRSSVLQVNHVHTAFIPHFENGLRCSKSLSNRYETSNNNTIYENEEDESIDGKNQSKERKKRSLKEKIRKLTIKLRRLTSNDSIKKTCSSIKLRIKNKSDPLLHLDEIFNNTTKSKLQTDETEQSNSIKGEKSTETQSIIYPSGTKFVSPFSGKTYDLSLPKVSHIQTISEEIVLEPVDAFDVEFIKRPPWFENYNDVKKEHEEILQACNDLTRNIEFSDKEIQTKIDEFDFYKYDVLFHSLVRKLSLKEQEVQTVGLGFKNMKRYTKDQWINTDLNEEENTLQNVGMNTDNEEDDEDDEHDEDEDTCDLESSKENNTLSHESIKVLFQYANGKFDMDEISVDTKPCFVSSLKSIRYDIDEISVDIKPRFTSSQRTNHYDLNYISNNLISISSRITDTEFLEQSM